MVKLISDGEVKSAILTDKNQTIQVTTKSGQQYQADFISGQGEQLQQLLQTEYDKGQLTRLRRPDTKVERAAFHP